MKNLFVILIFAFLGQTVFSQTGGWFWFSEEGKELSLEDVLMIVQDIDRGIVYPDQKYSLPSGGRYQCYYPEEWFELFLSCCQKADPGITESNLYETLKAKAKVVTWNDDMSFDVYNFSHEGREITSTVYNGYRFKTRVLVINGYAVLKMNCGNPLGLIIQEQIIAKKDPTPPKQEPCPCEQVKQPCQVVQPTYTYTQPVQVPVNPMINHGCTPKHYYGYNYGPNYVGPSCRPPSFIRVRISSCQPQQGQQSPRQSMGGHTAGR